MTPANEPMLGVVARGRLDLGLADLRSEQLAVVRGGGPERAHDDRDHEQPGAVEDGGDALGVGVADRLGDEPGREREERDRHQQQEVEPHQPPVHVREPDEDAMVREPDAADGEEARRVREICRPLLDDPAQQIVELAGRNIEIENEERDRDRDDAVAERLGATGLQARLHRAPFDVAYAARVVASRSVTTDRSKRRRTSGR